MQVSASEANSVSEILQSDEAVTKAASSLSADEDFNLSRYLEAQDDGYLFVEAIAFDFSPNYSRRLLNKNRQGEHEIFLFSIRGVGCGLQVMSIDGEIDGSTRQEGEPVYLLLARDRGDGLVYHYLLLVYIREGRAVRGTVMTLLVPQDHLEVLEDLKPQKRRTVLT